MGRPYSDNRTQRVSDNISTPSKFRLQRQSLPEALATSLRERILNGEFKEGEPLGQEAIAAEYECSRMPVREAFRQLEAAGLIELKVHKGAVVTSIPSGQIIELFDLRALLECEILAYSIPKMTSDDIASAQNILSQLEIAYHERDIGKWGALNWEFHRSLYTPAGRIQTMTVIQNINVQTDRYIRLHLLLTDSFTDAEHQHQEILRFCMEGDVKRAVPYLRKHILDVGKNLLGAIKSGARPQT
jgi:DNA-binding GntR family transcriptional regulator